MQMNQIELHFAYKSVQVSVFFIVFWWLNYLLDKSLRYILYFGKCHWRMKTLNR